MEEKESLSETRAEEVLSQRASAKKTSKESWYGTSILIVFGGAICVLFGSIGWWGYSRVYLPLQQEKTSISSLDQEVFESDKESVVIEEPLPEPKKETPTEVVLDITQESILVLNGGGEEGDEEDDEEEESESEGLKRLKVWVKAKDFALQIYSQVLPLLPTEEKWNLNSQLRRSSLSISANIAEGYGRFYFQDNVRFCYIARGSLDETLSHLVFAHESSYIPASIYQKFEFANFTIVTR